PATWPQAVFMGRAEAVVRAIKHIEAGRFRAAARLCHTVLAADPGDANALHALGVAMQKQGRAALGIELVKEAILRDNSIFHFHRNLCEMCRLENRFDEALLHGQRSLALKPDDATVHHLLGVVQGERGALDDSIRHSRAAIALDPGHVESHCQLAQTLLLRGDLTEGFAEYEWRHQIENVPPLLSPRPLQPLWEGQPLPPGGL